MKGMTLKRRLVAAFIVAAVVAFALFRPSTSIFSVRVVGFTAVENTNEDKFAGLPPPVVPRIEITNNTGSRLNLGYGTLDNLQVSRGELNPHEASILEFNAGGSNKYEVWIHGGKIISGPWMARCADALERVGIDLFSLSGLVFNTTNATGWVHPERLR